MRVILKAEIFASQHIVQLRLMSLIELGIDGRHLIQVVPPDADEMYNWLNKQSDDIRDECLFVFESGYSLDSNEYGQFSPFTIQVGNVDEPQWLQTEPLLPLDIALKFLSQHFIIFVENRRNDSAFLKTTATGCQKDKLAKFLENDWIKFETGGGKGEILKYVQEISEQPEKSLRHFVLFDSDAKRPKLIDKKSQKVVEACSQSVWYHMLRRREIENYLPLAALWEWTKVHKKQKTRTLRRKQVEAFKKLSLKQRHHFDMKKGFQGDFKIKGSEQETEKEKEHRLVGDFYNNVTADIRIILAHGFGEEIAELFKEEQFQIQEAWLHNDKSLILELEPMLERLLSLV
jgi:hypothetical protein